MFINIIMFRISLVCVQGDNYKRYNPKKSEPNIWVSLIKSLSEALSEYNLVNAQFPIESDFVFAW